MIYLLATLIVLMYFFVFTLLIKKRLIFSKPITSLYYIIVVGSVVINIVFTTALMSSNQSQLPVVIFGLFVFVSTVLIVLLISNARTGNNEGKGSNKNINGLFILLAGIPFFIVAGHFLFLGLSSAGQFGSTAWRTAISSSVAGYEYLIYDSGSIILASYIVSIKKISVRNLFIALIFAICATFYGGRILLVVALLIGFFIRLQFADKTSKNIRKILVVLVVFIIIIIGVAFLRYTNTENVDYSNKLFTATIQRQLSGNVYDFLLSYGHAKQEIASELIFEKLTTAFMPFVFEYKQATSIGAYLAQSAGRTFEIGHRISAVGEVFYIFGWIGVMLLSILFIALSRIADSWVKRSSDFFILGVSIAFGISFSFFIDIAFVFTSIYMGIYLLIISQTTKVIMKRRRLNV